MKDVKIRIYGGTFTFSPATKRYEDYQDIIVKLLKKYNDAWLEKTIRQRCNEQFDEVWRDELDRFNYAIMSAIEKFSEKAEIPEDVSEAIDMIRFKFCEHLKQQGLEAEQALCADATGAQKRLRALGMVIGQICVGAEQIEPLIRDALIEDGFIKPPSKKQKQIDGKELFRQLREGEVQGSDKLKTKLSALNAMPQNKDLIVWCWQDDDDKSVITQLAESVGVSLAEVRKCAFEKEVGPKDFSSEGKTINFRKRVEAAATKYGYDAAGLIDEIDKVLADIDQEARTAGDRIFDTREEAAIQRKAVEFERKLGVGSEDEAKQSKAKLEKFVAKLDVDARWTFRRIDAALLKFDEESRTAFGVLYEKREDVPAARKSRELFLVALKKAIEDCKNDKFYLGDKIPTKKLMGARTYLKPEQDVNVFALLDATLFGSAKVGLAVTDWGVVWKNDGDSDSKKTAYTWQELGLLPSAPVRRNNSSNIVFGKDSEFVNDNTDVATDDVLRVLEKFWRYAHEADSSIFDKTSAETVSSHRTCATKGAEKLAKFLIAMKDLAIGGVFISESIPEKKRQNAFVSMKVREPVGDIHLLIDATVWGSAKEGLLVTNKAIYFKNFMSDPVRIEFSEIKSVVPEKRDLVLNGAHFTPSIFDEDAIQKISREFQSIIVQK